MMDSAKVTRKYKVSLITRRFTIKEPLRKLGFLGTANRFVGKQNPGSWETWGQTDIQPFIDDGLGTFGDLP